MKKNLILLTLAFSVLFSTANAQIGILKDTIHDYCAVCHNHEHIIIKPPYTKTFRQELPFLLTSGLTFAAGFASVSLNKVVPYTPEQLHNAPPDPGKINALDRPATKNWSPSIANASDYVLFSTALLPALFIAEHHTDRDLKTLLVMYGEVFTLNYGLFQIAKSTANRPRPFVYNTTLDDGIRTGGSSKESFYSGHTAQTAAACYFFAKVITDYHPALRRSVKYGVWIFAATVPAINGYLRVKAGKHFPTDVMAGYVAGALTGVIIPQLHRTKASKDTKEQIKMGLIPMNGGMQVALSYSL